MESCEYTQVFTDAGIGQLEYDKNTWKPLLRQTIISFGVSCCYFMVGIIVGAPTVIIAQIRKETNSTEVINDEMLSWLTSGTFIFSVPFVVILPFALNRFGRKLTFFLVWLTLSIGCIILYITTRLYYLLFCEAFAGITSAAAVTILPVLISEYTSPKYRGIFLSLKSASLFWGIWVSNAVGTFFHWKNIAIIPFVCSFYIISMIIWPESPHWLAMKGRYVESAKAHRWLKGVSEGSEKELAQLITFQRKNHDLHLPSSKNSFFHLRNTWSILTSRSFYQPVLISLILFLQHHYTGKFIISLYAIDVLKRLTQDEYFVYIEMLILDGVTVFSMYVGCILSRYCNRRTLLISFTVTAILLLYTLSLYTYLVSLSILEENHFVIVTLLSAFSIALGCGPIILPTSIYGEIVPSRYLRLGTIIVGGGASINLAILLKSSPFLFRALSMHGCFLFFAIFSTVSIVYIYIYLPETKDKTMQEIEEYFADTKVSIEPSKDLLHTGSF